jgi:hypothetical protein
MFGRVWRDTSEKVNFKLQYAHTVDYSTWYVDFAAYRRWRGFIGLTLSLTAEVQLATSTSTITYSVKEALSREAVKLDWRLVLTR